MALADNELFASGSAIPAEPRFVPHRQNPKKIETDGAGNTYARLTPLTYDAVNDRYQIWADADTGKVDGLLLEETTLDATNQVIAVVVQGCEVHVDDIPTPTGQTTATLKTALSELATRQNGIHVKGLEGSA